ncbi:MAG: DUF1810 domain-containing protein [Lachnospiraceae bacterium]|nr:DUF1810 domain-containing protein [Lachnospiraceae bacterium]
MIENDTSNLERFIKAQERNYNTALSEIKSGYKRSHWIWYIFPQIQGLGFSEISRVYAIKDKEEAQAYINHPVLGARLIEITKALLELDSNNASEVMGYPDDLKLKSSMTLFSMVSDNLVFQGVLDKFFEGTRDDFTVKALGGER